MTLSRRGSELSRAAILTAARRQFQAAGFDRTNIRAVAAEASIDPALVIRYFGSKAGLFAAAVDADLALPDLAAVDPANLGKALLTHFIARWEGAASDDVLLTLLRSAVTHEEARERLLTIFSEQVVGALRPVVLAGELQDRAALVASQILGLALTRYVLRIPGIVQAPPAQVIGDVAPTIQRYLTEPITR